MGHTDADPNAWSAVVHSAGRFTRFPGNLTEILVCTLIGRQPRLGSGTPSAPARREH